MTNPQKKNLRLIADALNREIDDDTPLGAALGDSHELGHLISILAKAVTEGKGSLLEARETDGTLVGFVPRNDIIKTTTKSL